MRHEWLGAHILKRELLNILGSLHVGLTFKIFCPEVGIDLGMHRKRTWHEVCLPIYLEPELGPGPKRDPGSLRESTFQILQLPGRKRVPGSFQETILNLLQLPDPITPFILCIYGISGPVQPGAGCRGATGKPQHYVGVSDPVHLGARTRKPPHWMWGFSGPYCTQPLEVRPSQRPSFFQFLKDSDYIP